MTKFWNAFAAILLVAATSFTLAHSKGPFYRTIEFPDDTLTLSWLVKDGDIQFSVFRNISKGENAVPKDYEAVPKIWIALSMNLEKHQMKGSDMIVFVPLRQGCLVSDRWAEATGVPALDTDIGGSDDVTLLKSDVYVTDKHLVAECVASRALNTGDSKDHPIENRMIYFAVASGAFSDIGELQKHKGTIKRFNVNLITGREEGVDHVPGLSYWHGVLMFVSFVVLMVPASFTARYLKSIYPKWFFIHRAVQILAALLFVTAFILILVDKDGRVDEWGLHEIFGVVLAGLIPIQLVFGYLSNALWYEGKAPHFYPDKIHWWLGRFVMLFGIVNCVLGLIRYTEYNESNQMWWWLLVGAILALTFLIHVVFEVFVGQKHEHLMVKTSSDTLDRDAVEEEALIATGPNTVPRNAAEGRKITIMAWMYFVITIALSVALAIVLY
ncbi:hypothetical protein MP638_005172 [Amoeboaphelidium occidentale]|nr:hypothetical protein MP638_005172 [Amoeboaphelidium occidentale]